MSSFAKGINRQRDSVIGFRMPFALRDLELDFQYSIVEHARWGVVLINVDGGRLCRQTDCSGGYDQQQSARNRQRSTTPEIHFLTSPNSERSSHIPQRCDAYRDSLLASLSSQRITMAWSSMR